MPIVVKVRTKEEFESWLKSTAASQKQAAAGGSARSSPPRRLPRPPGRRLIANFRGL